MIKLPCHIDLPPIYWKHSGLNGPEIDLHCQLDKKTQVDSGEGLGLGS